ncbi:MAG TPA: VOC family protein [Actinospica sp.]|jgi:predicted enzyme related to lactoylglutathione lyase|nr:VOC family protein [Actinospica sp.]
MPNPVVHFEIGVKDSDAAAAFYRDLFGWEIRATDPEYSLVEGGADGGIGGGLMRTRGQIPSYVTVYVSVEDLATSLQHAVKLGGTELVKPTPIPGVGSFALFRDLDDNVIGLLQQQ